MSKTIKNYRKKPVAIRAMQFTGNNATEVMLFVGQRLVATGVPSGMEYDRDVPNDGYTIDIPTREGVQTAIKLDYIIKGYTKEAGIHCWVCKPDYFKEAYEESENQETDYLALYEIADKKAQQGITPVEARYNDQH